MKAFKSAMLFSFLIAAAFLAGCRTTVTKMNIASIDVSLEGSRNGALFPNEPYKLSIYVRTADGKVVDNPEFSNFEFTSPNGTFANFGEVFGVPLAVTRSFGFDMLDKKFELAVGIKGNPFPGASFSWDYDWSHPVVIDFSGKPGSAGAGGRDAANIPKTSTPAPAAPSGSLKPTGNAIAGRGRNGEDGSDGERGKDGSSINIDAAFYDTPNGRRLLVFENITRRVYISALSTITVNASGGKGGDGGRGGMGEVDPSGRKFTIGGDGGSGGNGGDGGNAGMVTVNFPDNSNVVKFLDIVLKGGAGGEGGKGGEGVSGATGSTRDDGRDGRSGRDGRDGIDSFTRFVPLAEPGALFSGITDPAFKRENLVWSIE